MPQEIADGRDLGRGLLGKFGLKLAGNVSAGLGYDLDATLNGPPQLIIFPIPREIYANHHFSDSIDILKNVVQPGDV